MRILFGTEPGDDLVAEELSDGSILLVETTEVMAPALIPFEEVRERVALAWREAKLAELAAAERERITDELSAGSKLEAVAAAHEASIQAPEGATRQGGAEGLTGAAREAAFSAAERAFTGGASAAGDRQIIVEVVKITPADIAADDPQLGSLSGSIGEAFSEDLVQQYISRLRDEVGYGVNQTAFRDAIDPNDIYLN
jgi:peptidyl-prolyl cis-trans isomerase D